MRVVFEMILLEGTGHDLTEAIVQWMQSISHPHSTGEFTAVRVMPNLTEVPPTDTDEGMIKLRFGMINSFDFSQFLTISPEESKTRSQWNTVVVNTFHFKILTSFEWDAFKPAVYLPFLVPEYSLSDTKRIIKSMIPTLRDDQFHLDWQYISSHEQESNIAVVMAKPGVIGQLHRSLTENNFMIKTLELRGIVANEIRSSFSLEVLKRHHYQMKSRQALIVSNVPSWANFYTMMVSNRLEPEEIFSVENLILGIWTSSGAKIFSDVLPGDVPTSWALLSTTREYCTLPDIQERLRNTLAQSLGIAQDVINFELLPVREVPLNSAPNVRVMSENPDTSEATTTVTPQRNRWDDSDSDDNSESSPATEFATPLNR